MVKGNLAGKIYMECPVCGKMHEVEERVRTTGIIMKGENISYEERFCICTGSDGDKSEFKTKDILDSNQMAARNAYRKTHGLLTADEIVAIRENYGLTQVELARLLGWGEATVARYESKAIQDEAYDNILRIIKDNPLKAIEFLDKNGDKFSNPKKMKIRTNLVEKLDLYGKEFLTRQLLASEYVTFSAPSDYNGYKLLDIDKIESAVSYFAGHIANLYDVKLMKMLWYADAMHFKIYGNSMTGLVYKHMTTGVLPIGHNVLLHLKNINFQEEEGFDSIKYRIYPNTTLDAFGLSKNEMAVLDAVSTKFGNYNAADIVFYMYEESAYKNTKPEDIIPFTMSKDVRVF